MIKKIPLFCKGEKCSKREKCSHYYLNNLDYSTSAPITDYSLSGLSYSKSDERGDYYVTHSSECGDMSLDYTYPYFTERPENTISVRQISQNICQLFEDILDKHNIDIPDPDREISEEDSSQAHIYGVTYFTLEDEVTEILAEFANRIKRDDIKIQTDTY